MQHLDAAAQVAVKQRILEDNLERIGKVEPEHMVPPIHGLPWVYRQRARLSVRHVLKKGRTLVGFHEKRSSYVADLTLCEILPANISKLIGFPGKLGMDGSKVWEAYQQGKLAEIRNYCETDVVNTWLVFARFQLMRGQFTKARYEQELQLVRDTLSKSEEAHWKEFLAQGPQKKAA